MSSDDSAAPYTPMPSYYDMGMAPEPLPQPRTPRRGPLSSRLEARARLTPLPDSGALPSDPGAPSEPLAAREGFGDTGADKLASAQAGRAWASVTGALRMPGQADDALRDAPSFGARWTSRMDMLGACLDEYYQLTAKYNQARTLLGETELDLAPLRQQQVSAYMTLRELEERLELHSRTELRAAYLGAAEIEMRVFRVEQERDLLSSRVETLEGFMGFLSRVIATIRGIPAEAMEQPAPEVEVGQSSQPAQGAAPDDVEVYEELVIDADEAAALVARGDVEVIGAMEEVNVVDEAGALAINEEANTPARHVDSPNS